MTEELVKVLRDGSCRAEIWRGPGGFDISLTPGDYETQVRLFRCADQAIIEIEATEAAWLATVGTEEPDDDEDEGEDNFEQDEAEFQEWLASLTPEELAELNGDNEPPGPPIDWDAIKRANDEIPF